MTFYRAEARLDLDTANPPAALADEIARFVMELEDGPARGVAAKVRDRLERRDVEQIEAERTMLSPEDLF